MLNSETKRRIDNLRDILVGKIPTPTGQVEQITLALIYKFMNDIDEENVQAGDKGFFRGKYEQYKWSNIVNPRIESPQMAKLYSDGLESMSTNPNIPDLFRDIFKNSYLPFKDPTIIKMFLKQIDEFKYEHSEELGNAFEYLLLIMGSQGDAGQFRTPRHIIKFIVDIVEPKKTDRILDPACGTAGFLISAFKYISKNNNLTPHDKNILTKNFVGYDIAPEMVRLSRVNLYLHHFPDPKIYEYDSLSDDKKWNERFDCILANPPFMSPKGGVIPHKRFQIQANRAEVLFVDYIMEHLDKKGKAGVIVPEGIIFQSANAYKDLRKMMVEDHYLWAVVSLPSGVFQPYSGVKTSILLFDKDIAFKSKDILFVKIENDGFDLGAQRRIIEKDDLIYAKDLLLDYKKHILNNEIALERGLDPKTGKYENYYDPEHSLKVLKSKIAGSGDYNLSGDRYRVIAENKNLKWPMVRLDNENYFKIESGGTPDTSKEDYWSGSVNWATLVDLPNDNLFTIINSTERKITDKGLKDSSAKLLPVNSILVSSRATIGRVAINNVELATNQGFKNIIIKDFDAVSPKYIAFIMTSLKERMIGLASGGTFKEISKTNFGSLEIPLPPLSVQQEIVEELDSYQKIIELKKREMLEIEQKIKNRIVEVFGV